MIPILSFGFGLFSLCMAFVQSFGAAVAVRFCESPRPRPSPPGRPDISLFRSTGLGIMEAGVFPGIAFFLSRFCA